jgi:hypothetical protein
VKADFFRPDGFAIGLFIIGAIMAFVPMMLMPGVIAIISAGTYWVIMLAVKAVSRRRA